MRTQRKMGWTIWVAALSGALAFAGCDSSEDTGGTNTGGNNTVDTGTNNGADGTGSDQDATVGTGDTGTKPDSTTEPGVDTTTEPGEDTATEPGEDTTGDLPDTTTEPGEDTTTEPGEDTTTEPGACEVPAECDPTVAENCPVPPAGTPDIAIEIAEETTAPEFAGGPAPSGAYELKLVEVYLKVFTGGQELPVPVSAASKGNTFGSALFNENAWGLSANLNMALSAAGQNIDFDQVIGGGGCYTTDGVGTICSDITTCAVLEEELPVALPTEFLYEANGTELKIMVILPKDTIISQVPPPYDTVLGGIAKDDLPIVLTMEALQ